MAKINQYDKRTNTTYVYESVSWWDKEKKQSRSKRTLIGKRDPMTNEIIPTDKRNIKAKQKKEALKDSAFDIAQSFKRENYGGFHLFNEIAKKLHIIDDLEQLFPENFRQIIDMAIFLNLSHSNSLSTLADWRYTHYLPSSMNQLKGQRLSEVLKVIKHDHQQEFFKQQIKHHSEDEFWIYDTTSISSYSEALERVQYGYNKESDPLAQLNIGMVIGEKSGIPVMYRDITGNIPDNKTIPWLISLFDMMDKRPIQLVLDRGFYSKSNIQLMQKENIHYIIAGKKSTNVIKEAIQQVLPTIKNFQNLDRTTNYYSQSINVGKAYQSVGQKSYRPVIAHVYYDSQQAEEKQLNFDYQLSEWKEQLEKNDLSKEKEWEKYFSYRLNEGIVQSISENIEVIQEKKKMMGYFVLLTSTTLNSKRVLERYRNKDLVEKSFHYLKDRLSGRRMRVSQRQTLEGKLFVQYIALILSMYMKKKMEDHQLFEKYTMNQIIALINRIERLEHPEYGYTIGEVLEEQIQLFKQLEIPNP